MNKDRRKIDLYCAHRNERGRITRAEYFYSTYLYSTNWSKTCREAVDRLWDDYSDSATYEGTGPEPEKD